MEFHKKQNVSKNKWATMKYCSNQCINKGRSPINKGIPLSEERKEHLRKVLTGRTCNTGRTHIKKGQRIGKNTEFKKGNIPWCKGKRNPHVTGPKNPKWKGGITPEHQRIRLSPEMKAWRIAVFERDDYTCQFCFKRGVKLNADHIKPFALHPELRFELSNGRTLCVECHRTTDTYGVNKKYQV